MARRDPAGLEGVYRRYADRLYAYCVSILHDRDAAADVLHDTFLIAVHRIHQLRDPDRLRAWLYAVAQRECLRSLRHAARDVPLSAAPGSGDGFVDPDPDLEATVHARQVSELVGAAVDGVSDTDRQVIHLSLRHGLTAPEIAAVLGVSVNHANARLSRARGSLLHALGALMLARAGVCPQVTALAGGWKGRLDPLLRKRISRHARGCEQCAGDLRDRLHPAALLSSYGTLPLFPVPAWVWTQIRDGTAGHPAAPPDITLDRTGFPAARRAGGRWWAAAAAVAALATAGAVLAPRLAPAATGGTVAAAAAPAVAAPAGTAPAGTAPAAGTPGGAPAPGASPTAGPTTSPAGPGRSAPPDPSGPPEPSGSPAPSTSAGRPPDRRPFTVTAAASADCGGSVGFELSVTVTGTVPLRKALLYWQAPDLDREPMARSGVTATFDVRWLRAPVTWWVEAVAVDGREFTTAAVTTADACATRSLPR